ncbi:MAG: hypothetical protein GX051_02210 [Clostridiales bacterium]|nr:hypothetical protein [Clostridiales bacterium]
MLKKTLVALLVFSMLFSVFALPVGAAGISRTESRVTAAADEPSSFLQKLYHILDKLLNWLLSYMNFYMPKEDWTPKEDYEPVEFYEGLETFDTAADDGAKWSVGYANASLIAGQNITDGKHYMGGSLSLLEPKTCTGITDDMKVRTFAISDGDDGIAVFAVLDAYALCSGDVIEIRKLLADFAEENNIVSINCSVLHQHSCVDTLGMNGELIRALVQNTATHSGLIDVGIHSGRNPEFMENLHKVVAASVKNAVNSMTEGSLYYGTADVSEFVKDKRDPQVCDKNLNRLRFVPDDTSKKETWIVSGAMHCVGLGADTTEVSGDYPYYIEKNVRQNYNANFVYIQGAQLAITVSNPYEGERLDRVMALGETLATRLGAIDNEVSVAPLLNIKLRQIFVPVEGQVLTLCANVGLFNTTVVDAGAGKYEMVTEVGYMELGNELAYFFAPGELAPEIAYGGAISAAESLTGESWDYPSIQDYIGSGRKLLVFGLTNDEVGYILTDNDYRSMFSENEEINCAGDKTGSAVMEGFMALYDSLVYVTD